MPISEGQKVCSKQYNQYLSVLSNKLVLRPVLFINARAYYDIVWNKSFFIFTKRI